MTKKILWTMTVISLFTACNKTKSDFEVRRDLTGEDYFKSIYFMRGDFAAKLAIFKDFDPYKAMGKDQRKVVFAIQDQVIDDIKIINPAFLDYFDKKIESGNEAEVNEALNEGAFALVQALNRQPSFNKMFKKVKGSSIINSVSSKTQAKIEDALVANENLLTENAISTTPNQGKAVAIVVAVYWAAAVHHTVAVTANVAVAVNVFAWVFKWLPGYDEETDKYGKFVSKQNQSLDPSAKTNNPNLNYEMLINQIVVAVRKP